ncbi:MAG: Extracellular matrix protein PelF, glycosyltransferase, group 1 [Labilithrix sp.]|nr:Extracellular matrix protein PelF, glycosyltransferase, group 1 [Labilithrix sp.]
MSRFGGPTLRPGSAADVTLLLEGTYPFVSGGVSSWVHQIIGGLPDLRFALVFIGGNPDGYERLRYELPQNVVHLEEHFLGEVPRFQRVAAKRGDRDFYRKSAELHDAFAEHDDDRHPRLDVMLERVVQVLLEDPERHEKDFLSSESAWEQICERYERSASTRSFLEYFWTVRSMHAPLFKMARVAAALPPSRAYHVVSTGFAGFLGALAQKRRMKPLILTEHGIYSKERGIELLQATWINDDDHETEDAGGIGFIRRTWIRFFEALGRISYAAATPILTLYEGNRQRQIRDGADPARTRIIPNGIDLKRYAALREKRDGMISRVLGLVGRVVPIKDIKTFIRAMRVVVSELPDAEGWIVGPEDEDKSYAEECHHLVRNLSLEGSVKFLGFKNVNEVFPRLGLNVLTSISEAQPLVVLEGFAAGVPCVSTDVGCVRELVHGQTSEDRELGAAGAVVDIASPEATARAALDLLSDPQRWYAAQAAGIARVEKLYTQELMLARYRSIYEAALAHDRSA